jgi:hypothetical protein
VADGEIWGIPSSWYIFDAGIVVPELRCPITPETSESTSFWATSVVFDSLPSSSTETTLNTMVSPSNEIFLSFASWIASFTPFSLSFPRCAMGPVKGPACPI